MCHLCINFLPSSSLIVSICCSSVSDLLPLTPSVLSFVSNQLVFAVCLLSDCLFCLRESALHPSCSVCFVCIFISLMFSVCFLSSAKVHIKHIIKLASYIRTNRIKCVCVCEMSLQLYFCTVVLRKLNEVHSWFHSGPYH